MSTMPVLIHHIHNVCSSSFPDIYKIKISKLRSIHVTQFLKSVISAHVTIKVGRAKEKKENPTRSNQCVMNTIIIERPNREHGSLRISSCRKTQQTLIHLQMSRI
ncbi:hypothetical protein GHT06_007881 [Daphnia sinensis]|uniref:Uncharacterized protein n=1 Tax=Daphnia sinensis TaxID=1820382 RepID=A0AAD5L351_9CRUS|nr:hypothetical protein GHT06_007881 [Daphnia sinensis]